jgi:hypothetical protein
VQPVEMTTKFYSERSDQSRVKSEIILQYFSAWATVVGGYSTKIAYIDLFAGRGRYDNGCESTPLLVLQRAIDDPVVSQMLVSIFNDKNYAAALQAEINALPGIERLKYKPTVYDSEVAEDTAKMFQSIRLAPTLAFNRSVGVSRPFARTHPGAPQGLGLRPGLFLQLQPDQHGADQ